MIPILSSPSTLQLASADLVIPRMEAWRLLWDFRTIRDLAKNLPENSPLGNKCMEVGNRIMNVFKVGDLSTIAKCREIAEKVRFEPSFVSGLRRLIDC